MNISNDQRLYLRGDAFPETLSVACLARWHFGLRMPWDRQSYIGDAADARAFRRQMRRGRSARIAVTETVRMLEAGTLQLLPDLVV